MLSYFVRYREFIVLNLYVAPRSLFTPVLTMDAVIQANADAAFNERLRARLEGV